MQKLVQNVIQKRLLLKVQEEELRDIIVMNVVAGLVQKEDLKIDKKLFSYYIRLTQNFERSPLPSKIKDFLEATISLISSVLKGLSAILNTSSTILVASPLEK